MRKKFVFLMLFIFFLSGCTATGGDKTLGEATKENEVIPELAVESLAQSYPTYENIIEGYPVAESPMIDYQLTPETPDKGLGSVSGKLYLNSGRLLPSTTIYLTKGKGENQDTPPLILIGPDKDKGDFVTMTDKNSDFLFSNVTPGNYFLVASSSNNWSIITDETNVATLVVVEADKIIFLGNIFVDLP